VANQADRRDYDSGASAEAQANFNAVASGLEALIAQRDRDVAKAMADYVADGVSEEYRAKEQRWHNVADQVRSIVATLRRSLEDIDGVAAQTIASAKNVVAGIG